MTFKEAPEWVGRSHPGPWLWVLCFETLWLGPRWVASGPCGLCFTEGAGSLECWSRTARCPCWAVLGQALGLADAFAFVSSVW